MYQKRSNHLEALLNEVEAAVARVEDLNLANLEGKQNRQRRKKLKIGSR